MQPEIRDAGYIWDMLDAAKTIREFADNVKYHEYTDDTEATTCSGAMRRGDW